MRIAFLTSDAGEVEQQNPALSLWVEPLCNSHHVLRYQESDHPATNTAETYSDVEEPVEEP